MAVTGGGPTDLQTPNATFALDVGTPARCTSRLARDRSAETSRGNSDSRLIEHRGAKPDVDPSAYVAPTAIVCGDVQVGAEARILFGTVLTAETDGCPSA